ncbi:MAG: CTP synthase [Alphaproteobacteria bacterium]|nr:CTP synthase [Alphaproteobacteria bacterium]MDA8004718.1 CTP synthase [Alphaproteobacteria bacterium]MDA8006428.1 CTP synthase [Alphaproteobacteria bacterium]MDA8012788.1 CTP synthase [Alphaproteobacteria bacterium]
MTRFIFVTGGVVSSLGKGLTSAALGALLQAHGHSVRLRKFDPYLNVDPGTMNPFEHGEVFVTDDGAETDLDLGHYERFTGIPSQTSDCVTTGKIYSEIIARERRGDYLGATVQVVPHVTDAIQKLFLNGLNNEDFCICEIGGTIGDIESLPFLEAVRQFCNRPDTETLCIHMTLVPHLRSGGELKTKPTQHSVRELQAAGIRPGMLVVRAEKPIGAESRRKLSLFCNLPDEDIIEAIDAEIIYELPLMLHSQKMDARILAHFNITPAAQPDLARWRDIIQSARHPEHTVRIGVIGKYTELKDAYLSLNEALVHGGLAHNVRVDTRWLVAEELEDNSEPLAALHGILVPGGFGERGITGKINAARFARERQIPYFGICLGMQIALIEIARSLCDMPNAGSSEFGDPDPAIVGLLTEWERGDGQIEHRSADSDLGGTMRLGAYTARLQSGSLAEKIYGADSISERHRHRYEVNRNFAPQLEAAGLRISGTSPDGRLPELAELADHPWFLGVQFHPELKSRPFAPHPVFASFVRAARDHSRLV